MQQKLIGACPFRIFRIYEDHVTHWDPRLKDKRSQYDTKERKRLMRSRNLMIKEQLTLGHPVQFRCLGDNLLPWVHSGECCIFEPVVCLSSLKCNDIIFCQTEPNGDFFAGGFYDPPRGFRKSARSADGKYGAWLDFGVCNWGFTEHYDCYGCKIYGRLVEVLEPRYVLPQWFIDRVAK